MKENDRDFYKLVDSAKYEELKKDIRFLISSAIFNTDSINTFTELFSNKVLYRSPDEKNTSNKAEAEAVFSAFEKSKVGDSSYLLVFEEWLKEKSFSLCREKTI